jgi:hypothetical protein
VKAISTLLLSALLSSPIRADAEESQLKLLHTHPSY